MADASYLATSLFGLTNTPFFVVEMFVYALLGGVLPSLLWMWFWMHESYKHDEPKGTISLAFIVGMCAVFLVYPFQKFIPAILGLPSEHFLVLGSWAFIEELFKLLAAFYVALKFKDIFNEPIDAFIYLMTTALGFVAMENTFYLLAPLLQGDAMGSIMTGNLRFMGASLLHVVASGAISICIAYGFYKHGFVRKVYWIGGLIIATILHTLFNYFIIITTQESTFLIFSFVWLTTILLILALERVKTIKQF